MIYEVVVSSCARACRAHRTFLKEVDIGLSSSLFQQPQGTNYADA